MLILLCKRPRHLVNKLFVCTIEISCIAQLFIYERYVLIISISGALIVKLFQYYKWSIVKFLYEDNPKPFHECQVLLRPIALTFGSNQIRSDNRKITSHDIKDNFKSIFIDFISNNASGNRIDFRLYKKKLSIIKYHYGVLIPEHFIRLY